MRRAAAALWLHTSEISALWRNARRSDNERVGLQHSRICKRSSKIPTHFLFTYTVSSSIGYRIYLLLKPQHTHTHTFIIIFSQIFSMLLMSEILEGDF